MAVTVKQGHVLDVLARMEAGSVQTVCTSPPYLWAREYGTEPQAWPDGWTGDLGQEDTPERYVDHMVEVFRAVWRVLRDDGTLWLNLGDTYYNDPGGQNGASGNVSSRSVEANRQVGRRKRPKHPVLKRKDRIGVPWRVALALQADGWYLRSEIIWHKPNALPDSATDRPGRAHEQVFLLSKRPDYYYDAQAVREPAAWERWGDQTTKKRNPGTLSWLPDRSKAELSERTTRNLRSVWTIPVASYTEAHFAVFPPALVEPCILAGSRAGDTVLDPFGGSGTVGLVAERLRRDAILIELHPDYVALASGRIQGDAPLFADVQHEGALGVAPPIPAGGKQASHPNRTVAGFNQRYKAKQQALEDAAG